jgi:DNA-directed RNA polymerase specialized sigma24 family protein
MLTAREGLDARAAAVALDCAPHAVHTRLHPARARLHAELGRQYDIPVSIAPSEVSR